MNTIADHPSAALPIERHEIIEERANRDAFRLCVLILVVAALGLVVLGIALLNTTIVVVPHSPAIDLPSLAPAPRLRTNFPAFNAGIGVSKVGLADSAARLGVSVPRNPFRGVTAFAQIGPVPVVLHGRVCPSGAESDAGDPTAAQSCRPEFVILEMNPLNKWAARASAHFPIRDGRERGSNAENS